MIGTFSAFFSFGLWIHWRLYLAMASIFFSILSSKTWEYASAMEISQVVQAQKPLLSDLTPPEILLIAQMM